MTATDSRYYRDIKNILIMAFNIQTRIHYLNLCSLNSISFILTDVRI